MYGTGIPFMNSQNYLIGAHETQNYCSTVSCSLGATKNATVWHVSRTLRNTRKAHAAGFGSLNPCRESTRRVSGMRSQDKVTTSPLRDVILVHPDFDGDGE